MLAPAHRDAGLAPGAALLPAQPSLVQGAPDRERADPGQPVRSLAQGFLQQAQGPSRRAVLVALGRARPFGQDALLRVSAIADPWSASVARPHGREPVAVEAADPGGDGLVVPSSDLVGGRRVAGAIRNGQERSGALDLRGGGAERAAQAGQLLALIRRERAKGIFPVARHGTPRGTRIIPPLYQSPRQLTHSVLVGPAHHSCPTPPGLPALSLTRRPQAVTGVTPDRVTTDGHGSYPHAIRTHAGQAGAAPIQSLSEQPVGAGHRGIKGRYRPMRGFKCPRSAARFCRAYDELRNFLRPHSRHHQHLPPTAAHSSFSGGV